MKEKQLDSLLENINYEISLLSNASAFIMQTYDDISWVGFYLCKDNQLILGPFQGKTACTVIPFNRGVCGACATTQKTICVNDVHQFAGHIACDDATNSELVIPIIINNQLYGVLDLDSISFNRFQTITPELESLSTVIIKHLQRLGL